jgi:hypothetical protein
MAAFHVEAGEPSAPTHVGVDVDGVAEIEGQVWGLLRGVAADHDFSRLVGLRGAELLVDEGEGMLL